MSSLSKLFVLFTLALSVSSLATPLAARSPHNHRALAARMAAPAAAPAVGLYGDDPVKVVKPRRRKRGDTARCRAQSGTAVESTSSVFSSSSSSSSSWSSSSSSEAPVPTTPVAAVAAAPSSSSTSTPESTSSTSTPAPETTTWTSSSQAAAPSSSTSSSSDSGGFLSGLQTGQATYYDVGLGACGITNTADQKIAAVSELLFDAYPGYDGVNPNSNPVCNKQINVNYNGKSTTVTVTDRCTACAQTDLDFSESAFEELADLGVGRLDGMTWTWS